MNNNEIIDQIVSLLQKLKDTGDVKPKNKVKTTEVKTSKYLGLTGELYSLVEVGFFKKHRTLGEIREKLRAEGTISPSSALMKPILRLVRKKVLAREKIGKTPFKYFER